MPESEPIAGIPWLLWRPSRPLRAPRTRAPIWLRSRRFALVRLGGAWFRLRRDRGVPLLAPVDHPIPVLALSTSGLARSELRIDSNLPVAEEEVPVLRLDVERRDSRDRAAFVRARRWAGKVLRRAGRRPGRLALPGGFGRPVVPDPSSGSPPPRPEAPEPLAGVELPPAPGVPEPVRVSGWYGAEDRSAQARARRRTT